MKTAVKHEIALFTMLLLITGCSEIKRLVEKPSPRQQYIEKLEKANLQHTQFVQQWLNAGEAARNDTLKITLPYSQAGYFIAEQPMAIGLRFTAARGQKITATLAVTSGSPKVFIEVFEVDENGQTGSETAHAKEGENSLGFEVKRNRQYLLRIQPELMNSGRYELEIRAGPSVAFPVSGKNSKAIGSFWHAPRDGGGRKHEGVDVFASRGTPVVAVADGRVTRTGTNRLGGKVVWLYDSRNNRSYYYAHLDSQLVSGGTAVKAGDTLGLVGNTGNAEFTVPHLHFGIYHRGEGAVDPLPFIQEQRQESPAIAANTQLAGQWVRVQGQQLNLRRSPQTGNTPVKSLQKNNVAQVLAITANWLLVQLPDARKGFISADFVTPAESSISQSQQTLLLHSQPNPSAPFLDSAAAPTPVYGTYNNFFLVKRENEVYLWGRQAE